MTRLAVPALMVAVVLTVLVVLGYSWFSRALLPIQCDGGLPRWMLYAQDYDGGGCATVLPSHEAPADADWTPYCMGMCVDMEPWPPPSGD